MITKKKDLKERQYQIPVTATFVVVATSLKDAQEMVESQLIGMNTVFVQVLDGGQALVPQISVEEDDNGISTKH